MRRRIVGKRGKRKDWKTGKGRARRSAFRVVNEGASRRRTTERRKTSGERGLGERVDEREQQGDACRNEERNKDAA